MTSKKNPPGKKSTDNISTPNQYDYQVSATEVARKASVSLMTVSRVFRNPDSVSEKTRDKVLEIANELGYHPNMAARALRTGRSGFVGFLMTSFQSLRGEFHSESFAGFESVISSRGLNVVISITPSHEKVWKRAEKLVATGTFEAIAVRFDLLTHKDFEELSKIKAPVVLVNYNPDIQSKDLKLSTVGYDNRQGTQQAVRYLASIGHRRIAYLGGTTGWLDTIHREQGFRSAMKELGLPINMKWVYDCAFERGVESGSEGMAQIFASGLPGPTAVICASDEIAAGAITVATRWGKSIPKDFSVIGFDDDNWSSFATVPLTTIRHKGWTLGEQVGKILLELINNPNTKPQKIVLDTQLVIRDSTGPAPKE